MFYGTFLVLRSNLSLAQVMAFKALAAGILTLLNNLVSSALQLQMCEVYVGRLNEVMDMPPEQDISFVSLASPLSGSVIFENVSLLD